MASLSHGYDGTRYMNKDTSVIPVGMYCYEWVGTADNGDPVWKNCPYWSRVDGRDEQENGYCSYMEKGDWEFYMGLLWDQCKECGVNMGEDE